MALKIVFFGTPDFAATALRRLAADKESCEIVAAVTATDKPAGRGHKLLQSTVKQTALELGIPVIQPEKLRSPEFLAELQALDADLFVVIAFRMLPKVVWAMPRLGTFNLHGSLLPRYRGAAPINHALFNGDSLTGVTAFFINENIDTGDIIDRAEMPIDPDDDFGSLYEKLMHLGADLTLSTVKALAAGTVVARKQIEGDATEAPKIFADDCRLDFTQPASVVRNRVRGLSPVPGARASLAAPVGDVKLLKVSVVTDAPALAPGEWRIEGKRMLIGCGDATAISVDELQPQGKRRMPVADYLNGLRL